MSDGVQSTETEKLEVVLNFLLIEVERYVDRPGCNAQSRATAAQRLQWAGQEARRRLEATKS